MTKLNIENKSTGNQSSVFFQACTGRTVIVLATGPDINVQSVEIIVHNIYIKSRKYAVRLGTLKLIIPIISLTQYAASLHDI